MTETQKQTKGIILWGVGGLYGVRPYAGDDLSVQDGDSAADKAKAAAENGAGKHADSASGADPIICRARGAFRHEGISPLPGDAVKVICDDDNDTPEAPKHGVIDDIYPRRTSLVRPALANLTHLFAVIPAARPAPVLLGADKLICAADNAGIEPVIVITKSELDPDSSRRIEDIYKRSGFAVFALCGDGSRDGELTGYMAAEAESGLMCAAFAGVSGAGKSTLMSRIFPSLSLKTGELSKKIQRGRHTTRHAELYPIDISGAVCSWFTL